MQLFVDSLYASPYALSVFVALRVKQLDFSVCRVDLQGGAHRDTDYTTTSMTARVPTLIDGDFSLSESSAVTEYLEDRYPQIRLYPESVEARARARQVQAWLRSDLLALRAERPTEVVFFGSREAPLSEAGRADADKLIRVAESLLGRNNVDLFQTWSIADVDLALMLNRLVRHGDEVPMGLVAYADRQWAHPAVAEWMALPRPPLAG